MGIMQMRYWFNHAWLIKGGYGCSETNLKPRKAPPQTGHLNLREISELAGVLQCEVLLLHT